MLSRIYSLSDYPCRRDLVKTRLSLRACVFKMRQRVFPYRIRDQCETFLAQVVMCIMDFGSIGLLRIGELARPGATARLLKENHVLDVLLPRSHEQLKIDGSKTDPFHMGIAVPLAEQDDHIVYPVNWRTYIL
eukprot:gb/GEZN01005626.1/.p1 GENE.gb/GEZN01005626.1/~~gb/GEZN01005626.1/.p1  ORF type:complete len:133 (-),score=1.06 gb/GEZN01005626.1/:42-440(-)